MILTSKPNDKDLLHLLHCRSETAFVELYDMYAPALYGLILKKVEDKHLAGEILQKAFLTIWKECAKPECIKQRLFTWILSLTCQTALSQYNINLHTSHQTSLAVG